MVSMCAACDALNTGAAFGIGAIAGMTLYWVSAVLKKLHIDDPLDAFAVHYGYVSSLVYFWRIIFS